MRYVDPIEAARLRAELAKLNAPPPPIRLDGLDGEITNPPAPPRTADDAHASHVTTCSSCGGELPPCPHCAAQGTPPSITALPPSGGSGADVVPPKRDGGGDEDRTLAEVRADNARWEAELNSGGGFAYGSGR